MKEEVQGRGTGAKLSIESGLFGYSLTLSPTLIVPPVKICARRPPR